MSSIIHMDTEIVLNLSNSLNQKTQIIADSLNELRKLAISLDWQGNSKDIFEANFSSLTTQLSRIIEEVEVLDVSLKNEINQWVNVDISGQTNISSVVSTLIGIGTIIVGKINDEINLIANKMAFREWWGDISYQEKIDFLREQQKKIAEELGIDYEPFAVEDLKDGFLSDNKGKYDPVTGVVTIDIDNIDSKNPSDALEILAHEMRHRYQDQAVEFYNEYGTPPEGVTLSEIESWKDNMENYITPQEDFQSYHEQPIEVDARDYADDYIDDVILDKEWEN